jgi:hypothetical protein
VGQRFGNFFARVASGFTTLAHMRAPEVRWGMMAALALIWLVSGYYGWILHPDPALRAGGLDDALYRTFAAFGVDAGTYGNVQAGGTPNPLLNVARLAGFLLPLVGLVFAFSGQLGLSLAQLFNRLAANHVVIAGAGPAALSLARDCAAKGDVVAMIAPHFPEETAWALRRSGIMIAAGDPTMTETLKAARSGRAAHVVALAEDDPTNLRIEAAVRAVAGAMRRRKPLAVHVGMKSAALLQEAREMRALETRTREDTAKKKKVKLETPAIDPRPFSLDELAARRLMVREAGGLLSLARTLKQERPHLVCFGFDEAAEAVAARALMTLWSALFDAPRVTVLTPDPDTTEALFEARYPHAREHAVWKADIQFMAMDWRLRPVNETLLAEITDLRGQPTAVVISTGDDATTIQVSLALLRAANSGLTWPLPIFMKEANQSEFSKLYASGDLTPDELDAYLQAFGACEEVAVRALIVEGGLDVGAAIAHNAYQQGITGRKEEVTVRDLEALRRGWDEVAETYRNANRATADHAVVKLWDAGWAPLMDAPKKAEKREDPKLTEAQIQLLARREHDRWVAERLMGGWRPPRDGEGRDNRLRIHPNLVSWDKLTVPEQERDADQVRASIAVARALYKHGFVRRDGAPL